MIARSKVVAPPIGTRFSGYVEASVTPPDGNVLHGLRHSLLRATSRNEALGAATVALRALLALPGVSAIRFVEGAAEPDVPSFAIRSLSGREHGHLTIVAEEARIVEKDVRIVVADLAEALDNVEAHTTARDVTRLRAALERRDELVRQAGDALMRDAHEVVRVVAELEKRDILINEELQHALRFQKAMIAPLPEHGQLSASAIYLAADLISGDFYDVAFMEPARLRILLADATGHGVAAGLATMFIKSEYEAQKRLSRSPAAVLRAINEQLSATYQKLELQFTALCMDLDLATGRLRYASAAHPGPIRLRSGIAKTLPSGGPFVGVMTGVEFPEHEVTLERGDTLVAFTDGLLDATSGEGEPFGEAGIARALGEGRDGAETCPALVRELATFVGEGRGLPDDVTIVAFSRRGSDTA